MYLLLENDSWYKHYLVEDGDNPVEPSTPAADGSGARGEEPAPEGDAPTEGAAEEAPPEDVTDAEADDALKNLSAAEFAEKYQLLKDNSEDPGRAPELVTGGFLDVLFNLGAVLRDRRKQKRASTAQGGDYGAAADYRLSSSGLRKFKEEWLKEHYEEQGIPRVLVDAAYSQVDDKFTPDKNVFAAFLENLLQREPKFDLKVDRSFAQVVYNLISQKDATFEKLVRDPKSLIYNAGLYEGNEDPTYSLKTVSFLHTPNAQKMLRDAGNLSLIDFMDGDALLPANKIKEIIAEADKKLASKGASGSEQDNSLRSWLASQKVSQANLDPILRRLGEIVGGELASKLPITPKQYQGYVKLLKEEPSVMSAFLNARLPMKEQDGKSVPDVAKFFLARLRSLTADQKSEIGFKEPKKEKPKPKQPTLLSFMERSKIKAGDRYNTLNAWVEEDPSIRENLKSAVRQMLDYYHSDPNDPRSFTKMLGSIRLPAASKQEAKMQLVAAAVKFQRNMQSGRSGGSTIRQALQERGVPSERMIGQLTNLAGGDGAIIGYIVNNLREPDKILNLSTENNSDEAIRAALLKAASR